jgi:FkbM family methyltransferase
MNSSVPRPVAFVLAATEHGSLILNRNDHHETPRGGFGVGYQLLERSAFDPDEVNLVLQLLGARREQRGDGVVALDCGANIGVHSVEWSRFMHSWGRVLAFEAQERIFYALAGNLALNNCLNARAIWSAVGRECGEIRVPILDYTKPASFGSLEIRPAERAEFIGQKADYSGSGTSPAPLISIDSLKLPRVDLIKIDVEGMELEVLEGARESIQSFKPSLLIEAIKSSASDIASFLQRLGYKATPAGLNLLAVHESDPLVALLGRKS